MAKDARELLELIEEVSIEVIPKSVPTLIYPDIADKPFLEAAVYVDGILITNNLRDFPFLGVRILRAGEFLGLIDQA